MTNAARTWTMFGHDLGVDAPGSRFVGVEVDRTTADRLNAGRTVIELTVCEDVDGEHLGWEYADAAGVIRMVQHRRIFNMQFAYGYKAEETSGTGTAVPITISRADTN